MRNTRFEASYSTEPRYNTKVVVRETGVPADTFRAWERRYRVPLPHRTATGQRLYSERDIALIRWLRDRTAEGLTASQAVRMLEDGGEPGEVTDSPVAWTVLVSQLMTALLRLDAAAAEAVLAEAFALYAVEDVCIRLIAPILVAIGDGWHAGTISVGQEHFATELLRRKLQSLLGVYDIVSGQATIVAACAPGEQHDVGLMILTLALVRRGYRVIYLGANVPTEGLRQVVQQVSADAVCISTTTPVPRDTMNEIARALRSLSDAPIMIVGGPGIDDGTQFDPGERYSVVDGDATSAAKQIASLIAARRSAE
jgi:methanogenic corrinoid protein MtbC1